MNEIVLNFSESIFSFVVVGSIIGVGFTLVFLLGILVKEMRAEKLW
ncbi:hypothetical protein [uncultured Castellaniella sp.]|nr:hypothetical protein [uncultured Castellaniella sp.]